MKKRTLLFAASVRFSSFHGALSVGLALRSSFLCLLVPFIKMSHPDEGNKAYLQ